MTIRCAGLTALAISAFAATTVAAPVLSSSTTPADFADGLTLVSSPTIAVQFSRALAHGIRPSQKSSGGTKVVSSVPFNTASSSLIGVLAPQPALLGRSDNLLTFSVGGEQVAPLTEDQTWDVIAGTALVSGELPFYVYVARAQQWVRVKETTINAPVISTNAMGARAIGGLAGLGLLAMAALVAVCLKHAAKRHAPRRARLDQRAKLKDREYRHTYAEHRGSNSHGAPSTDLAMLGLRHPFTRQDVNRAFRAKALEAHPDRGGDPDIFRSLLIARDRTLADVDDEEPMPGPSQPGQKSNRKG